MVKPLARALVIASIAVFAVGPTTASATTTSSGTPVYTHADSGKRVGVTYGEKFKVRLTQCAVCSYRWGFVQRPDKKILKLVRRHEHTTPGEPGTVGGGSTTITWTYKAIGYGKTTLKLADGPIGEPDNNPSKRFTLKVISHEALVVD